jgi:two-component system, OmpR family, sensor histidine kinase PrrB
VKPLPRGLRAQLTTSVSLLVMLVVALAGLIIALRIDHRERSDVDRQLTVQAGKVRQDAGKLLADGGTPQQHPNDEYGELLSGSQTLVRLLSGGTVVAERGDRPDGTIPVPEVDGFSTLVIDGQPWRSLVEPLDSAGTDRLQILQNTRSLEERLDDNRRIVLLIAVLATVLAASGCWLVGGLVLRPLQRLRTAAVRIQPADTRQLPRIQHPREVADLSATLNTMLDRLQTAMTATRRFTADAGHELRSPLSSFGMDLETLTRNPDLPGAQRREILAAMTAGHRRLVAVLDGLQALARGDAGALPVREPVDVADVVATAVEHARRRHPSVDYLPRGPQAAATVGGWAAGLRLAVDNLLDNAALHGSPAGIVEVSIAQTRDRVTVTVDDDGPGIPAADREAMTRRFTRGASPRSNGSGLGLALVQQQASLHGGSLVLADSPLGGLSAALSLRRLPPAT